MGLIESFRRSKGWTLEQFAEEVGLGSKGYLSRIERGVDVCPLRLALKIEALSEGAVPADGLVAPSDRELLVAHRALAASAAEAVA